MPPCRGNDPKQQRLLAGLAQDERPLLASEIAVSAQLLLAVEALLDRIGRAEEPEEEFPRYAHRRGDRH